MSLIKGPGPPGYLCQHMGRVLSPVSVLSEESTVDQLINRDSRWWNSALVDLIFIPCEAQLIKSIPVCLSAQRDFLVWPHSRTGMYQVRSGYHLLCESHGNEVASSSDIDAQRKFWNSLWKLNILNKVKIFLWRACTNSIPTMLNLCTWKIVPSLACNHCHVGEESVLHALWSCEAVCSVWCSYFPVLPSEFSRVSSFRDLFELVVCSSLNSEVWPLNQVASIVRLHLQEFQPVPRCPSKKVNLDTGFVKANFDGAIFEDISAVGVGVAIQNEHGEVVAALAEKIPVPDSVFTHETLAARRVVLFVQELGLRNVVFEGDSRLPFKLLVIEFLLICLVDILLMTYYCL
nr:uncharacterized protein LOC111992841 [Quercus suber]